jgi:hypothetical protein
MDELVKSHQTPGTELLRVGIFRFQLTVAHLPAGAGIE